MKVTKSYLKQVIKEELERFNEEQELEEVGFLKKVKQAVFGKNKEEEAEEMVQDWFEQKKGKELISWLEKKAKVGELDKIPSHIKTDQLQRKYKSYFPPNPDFNSFIELAIPKYLDPKLKKIVAIDQKARDKQRDEYLAKRDAELRARAGLNLDQLSSEEKSCLEEITGLNPNHESFKREYEKIMSAISSQSSQANYGIDFAHPLDIAFQKCQGTGSRGLSGKLNPYTGGKRRK